ncbi:uncharacterized protein LOC120346308 [Styela clava]
MEGDGRDYMREQRRQQWDEAERRMSSSINTETLNPSAALLADDQDGFLDSIHEKEDHVKRAELAEWIGGILGEDLNSNTLMDDLNNGVKLLYLAKSIQLIKSSHLKNSEYMEMVKNLQPDEIPFTDRQPHKRASVIAKQRSNIAKFLEWCRHSGVPPITLFETEDLVHDKNHRQVTTCLLYVARIASKYGIEPPSSVKEEMEKEARLHAKNTSLMHKSPSSDKKHLIRQNKSPIYEHEDEEVLKSPISKLQESSFNSAGKYDTTSTPFSTSEQTSLKYMKDQMEPIPPMELDFNREESDVVVLDTYPPQERQSMIHFETKPQIEDVEIKEMQDMVIIEQLSFRPIDVPVDHDMSEFVRGSKSESMNLHPDMNENTESAMSDSSFETTSSSENEYYTAHDVASNDDITDLMYHTAFVDDVSDSEDAIDEPKLAGEISGNGAIDIIGVTVTSSDDMNDVNEMEVTSPFSLFRVPADIVVQREEDESSEESTTDVESYTSEEEDRHDVTYTDVAVGTDDIIEMKEFQSEIMINFPPYFEITNRAQTKKIEPDTEYIVAPVRNEPIYAVSTKSSSRNNSAVNTNSSYRNDAYESEQESLSRPSRDYHSAATRHYTPSPSTTPSPLPRSISNASQRSKGTQTHVSLTQDIVRIINEMEDIPRLRTASSSASSGPINSAGHPENTIVVRAQYQQHALPTADRDVAVIQTNDHESVRPPRVGSVTESSRYKNRDVEAATPTREVRRSLMRRASSAISEQFEKAVVVAKKYKKQIAIIAVLLILTAGALAAMIVIFPMT